MSFLSLCMRSGVVFIPQVTIHPNYIVTYKCPHGLSPSPVVAEPPLKKVIPSNLKIPFPEFIDNKNAYSNYITPSRSLMPEKKSEIKYGHLLKSKRSACGKVSNQAKRKMLRAIDYLLLLASDKKVFDRVSGRSFTFKIAFVTLTLPANQVHTDKEIKDKCLNSLLLELKHFYKVVNYVWRAEKQKNGNIHFHLVVDKFIPYSELRNRWNRIINKLGYVDQYRVSQKEFYKDGFQVRTDLLKTWSKERQLAAYHRNVKCQWNNPNSTDIHSVRKVLNLRSYFSKYLVKNDEKYELLENSISDNLAIISDLIDKKEKRKHLLIQRRLNIRLKRYVKKHMVTGRIWGSSQNLSGIPGAVSDVDQHLSDEIDEVLKNSKAYNYHSSYFDVWYISFDKLSQFGGKELFKMFSDFLIQRFGYHYQLNCDQ